jgi:opacity protein-like surface antigen
MTKRNMVKRLAMRIALLCATLAAMGTVAVGAASAMQRQAPEGYPCEWENVYARPTLWIREYPTTSAYVLYGISFGGHFFGTPYEAFNNGVHWVGVSSGGYANASYLELLEGSDAYCE